jgi:replication-associated recombination protein RarA
MPAAQPTSSAAAGDPTTPHRALYRKFRAQRFGEVIGQDPIVTTLRHAITGDRLAHAYLFVGPRGTGKTSTARILAKAINCTAIGADGEPCDACPACVSIRDGRALDVIEIDAASHGAVEDARDLVMRALTSPSELKRRVYIIDEVHMLSTHAFNALLKLIEEPPDHVVFILATTDTHKVPATIISRTQRHDFRRLGEATIVGKLGRICAARPSAWPMTTRSGPSSTPTWPPMSPPPWTAWPPSPMPVGTSRRSPRRRRSRPDAGCSPRPPIRPPPGGWHQFSAPWPRPPASARARGGPA